MDIYNLYNRKQVANRNKNIVIKYPQYIPITYKVETKHIQTPTIVEKIDVDFFNGTTNQAVQYYLKQCDYSIVILNMANSHEPGGGYLMGASAQEEELCRTSPFLYASLADKTKRSELYDGWGDEWHNRVLYTEDVLFVRADGKTDNYNMLDPSNYYRCSVVSAAAPDMRYMKYDNTHEHKMKSVIKQIYYTPFMVNKNKKDILILSAWGSGAFAPDHDSRDYSRMVANYFCDVLSDIGKYYTKVCFAITTDHKNNFEIFLDTFIDRKKDFASVNAIVK